MSNVPSETGGSNVPGDKRDQAVTITRIIIAAAILFVSLALIVDIRQRAFRAD